MIRGLHGLLYSSEPDAARDFIKNKLRLPYSDVGEGWLIFDLPEGDLGVHPTEGGVAGGSHDVSFYCDDIEGTVRDLERRGVRFEGEIEDRGYGLVTHFAIPGGLRIQLYEPRYQKSTKARPAGKKSAPRKAAKKPAKKAAKKPAKKTAKKKSRR